MSLFKQHNVVPLVADLTKPDSDLWQLLSDLGRNGLPTYVLYHSNGQRELLPEGPPLSLKARVQALENKDN